VIERIVSVLDAEEDNSVRDYDDGDYKENVSRDLETHSF
jgi:hypothetical protein